MECLFTIQQQSFNFYALLLFNDNIQLQKGHYLRQLRLLFEILLHGPSIYLLSIQASKIKIVQASLQDLLLLANGNQVTFRHTLTVSLLLLHILLMCIMWPVKIETVHIAIYSNQLSHYAMAHKHIEKW